MTQACKRIGILLPALLLAAACETVRYRTYDFEWTSSTSPRGVDIDVVTTGTSVIQDSSGALIERRASPYRVGIYVDPPLAVEMELIEARFVGEQSGAVVTPATWSAGELGDGGTTRVFVAPAVELPFEDYRVEMRVRVGEGSDAREARVTGRLKTKFEHSRALRFWEEWMSV